jgi:hypothetical protein
LLARPKDEDEKLEDLREQQAAEINILHKEWLLQGLGLLRLVNELKEAFGHDNDKLQEWLKQQYPEPPNPDEEEFGRVIALMLLAELGLPLHRDEDDECYAWELEWSLSDIEDYCG